MTDTDDIIRKNIKRELPVKLDNSEMLDIAIAKANAEGDLDELQVEFRDVKAEWNQRIEEQEKRIAIMSVELRTKEQKRVVVCFERFRAGTIEVVRDDTKDVIERRSASLAEAQKAIPGTDVAAAAAAQKAANVEEDDEGDIVAPAGDGKKQRSNKAKR